MSLAWYEKIGGAGRSGQVVSSEQLLNELRRLDCRFRQRGSHITFHHDETATRGTIVYGTRKLWSQKTVASALARIQALTTQPLAVADAGEQEVPQTLRAKFSAVSMPALPLPKNLMTDVYQDDPSQIILRDRNFPQIGGIITPYDHPDTVKAVLDDIARKTAAFEKTLGMLENEADFTILREGDVVFVSHPVYLVNALLGPYDPAEMQDPESLLEQCFDAVAPYADNQRILNEVIQSRRLTLLSEQKQESGLYKRTYVSRRFQRGFGVRVELEASHSGFVTDEKLVGFLDDVDKQFFDSIENFMKNSYGFQVSSERYGSEMKATHLMLKDVDFRFPKFDSLPKLRDLYAKREGMGDKKYIDSLNDVLERRDDILELVSYGLIFSVEQMVSSSNALYDIMDRIEKLTGAIEKLSQEAEDRADLSSDGGEPERTPLNTKSLRKKFKKMESQSSGSAKAEYDMNGVRDQNHISSIRNQSMPESFPYGRIMSMPLKNAEKMPVGNYQYMMIKGPDGDNLIVFAEEGMNIFKTMLDDFSRKLPEGYIDNTDTGIAEAKATSAAAYQSMIPVIK